LIETVKLTVGEFWSLIQLLPQNCTYQWLSIVSVRVVKKRAVKEIGGNAMKILRWQCYLVLVGLMIIGTILSRDTQPIYAQGTGWEWQNPLPIGEILNSVWGSSGSDVFAVGYNGTIVHYDGSNWSTMNSGTTSDLTYVWGSSGSNVFAVGYNGTIVHYDGTNWSTMNTGTTDSFSGVWGSSGSDVFAVGYNGTILHYDGANWSTMNSGTTDYLSSVWGSSGSDVFAVGAGGIIVHYDGTNWSTMNTGTTSDYLNGV